ncbi:MAG TPA: hypothetical protein VM030_04000 [Acidimicrobiales bacterium]|nr:hypothetical protein [Acidimicrobiales bacterium]
MALAAVRSLDVARELARPTTTADEHLLPVAPSVADLVPGAGLRRGTVVSVIGSTSVALALAAGPSAADSWTAAVGMADVGIVAASELGVDLDRLALVPDPGSEWAAVVAAVLDGIDVVLARPPAHLRPADARRLVARARDRGGVLIVVGAWPEGADLRLTVTGREWAGLGDGHGHLGRRRLTVEIGGRGAAARPRRAQVVL